MPWSPARFCAVHGCGELTHAGRCAKHRAEREKERRERETWRDYNSAEWKRNRATVLRLEPQCRACGEPATVVDHVVPLQDGGTHDVANLRPLCKRCHDRRTYSDTLKRDAKRDRNDTKEG